MSRKTSNGIEVKSAMDRTELHSFYDLLHQNYTENSTDFPSPQIFNFNQMNDFEENGADYAYMHYDPIMDPLVQSSLVHFLYLSKCGAERIDLNIFHPHYLRLSFIESLVARKSTVTLGSFRLYELSPGSAPIDREKLIQKVDRLVNSRSLRNLVYFSVQKLQSKGDQLDRIQEFVQSQRNPNRDTSFIYLVLMDLYLEDLDSIIFEIISKTRLNIFWTRRLTTAFLGILDPKAAKCNHLLKLSYFQPGDYRLK